MESAFTASSWFRNLINVPFAVLIYEVTCFAYDIAHGKETYCFIKMGTAVLSSVNLASGNS